MMQEVTVQSAQITSRNEGDAGGFVNRWSGVQSSHPAPQQNQHNIDAAGFAGTPAHRESGESGESNVDLPYRKSGHSGRSKHVLDQRSQIGGRVDAPTPLFEDVSAAAAAHARSQDGSHDGPARPISVRDDPLLVRLREGTR